VHKRGSMEGGGTPSEREVESGSVEPRRRSRAGLWLSRVKQRAPFKWPRQRKRRWLVGLLLALLAYPVLGTLALWTGLAEWLLKSEDLRIEIQNPAYTIWPGRVRMKHVRILANGTTQFILEGQDLLLNVRMLELVQRRVHVTELAAHDAIYQMRVQVKDTKGIEKRVAAYPPLRDLPGAKVIREPTAKQSEETDSDWTVEVEGLNVAVKELWFFEYRYLGKGYLRGGFTVGPNVMEVSTAVQDFGPGDLRFGPDQTVATKLRGQITADIPRLNPKERADASFMELVTARVNLRADVQSLANLGAYAEALEVSHGNGPLALDLYLDRGRLGPKSHLDYETASLRVRAEGFGVDGDYQLKFDASGSAEQLPLLRSSSKSTYVSLARGRRELTVQIHDHQEEARLDTIQLSRSTDLKGASVRMPRIISVDLNDLPVVLPEGAPVEVTSGEARASLNLDMDENYWARGPLSATIEGLALDAAGVQIGGDLKLKAGLRFNPKLKTNFVENLAFTVREMSLRAGERRVREWWMNLDSKRLAFWNTEPPRFQGVLGVRARDLQPVLESLAEKEVISELIPLFTSLTDFRASTSILAEGPVTDVTLASESDVWDIAGRIYKKDQRSQMAVVVGGQAVSLGIASSGDGLELMPFAKTNWLNERLRQFPKPLQMRPDKP
jgi:hypothetical protein